VAEPAIRTEPAAAKERRFPCKGCGAALLFQPGSDTLACPHCRHVEKIPTTAEEIEEFSFNDYLGKARRGIGGGGRDARCTACGAVVRLSAESAATRCAFCGTPLVEEVEGIGGADVRPEAVAPFRIDASQAQQRFRIWVARLWFAPAALAREARGTRAQGIYRAYWTFDAHTVSRYRGERGDARYTTVPVTTWVRGRAVVRMQTVRTVTWSWREGTHAAFFDDVLVPAGRDRSVACHFSPRALVPYAPEFLSGFEAERPSTTPEEGWTEAKEIVAAEIHGACCREIGGDEQRSVRVDTAYRGITFKLVLLPAYLASYRYGERVYRFHVDGQTGAVHGERPWSAWKIAALVAFLAAAAGAIALVASR
jgi:DNA-directed RNA polymerase subunit RPC12/RpoP